MTRAIEKLHPQNALTVLEQEMEHFMDKFFGRHPVRAPFRSADPFSRP